MDWHLACLLLVGAYGVLLALGLPVAFAFFAVNVLGAYLFLGGEPGLVQLVRNCMTALTSYTLTPIPLFLLMGEILFRTGVAAKAIDAIDVMIARVPGRLSIVSLVAGTIFSALSGSTIANVALLGSVLLPEMLRRNYQPGFAMGPIMAVGGIAMLIPPSALAVLLGSLAGISIAKLLVAGIIPGLIMSALFIIYVTAWARIRPDVAPVYATPDLALAQRLRPIIIYVLPLFSIFIVVVGSIFLGVATPTDSAALGSLACLVLGAAYRSLRIRDLIIAFQETAKITGMILFIIVASLTFSQILAISGATSGITGLVSALGLSPFEVVLWMMLVLLILGCLVDQISMMLLTLPIFIPLAHSLSIDLVWLGLLMLIAMEISLLTPPFGLLLFTMKGIAPRHITMQQVMLAAMPFLFLELLVFALIILFPDAVMWLPNTMGRGGG